MMRAHDDILAKINSIMKQLKLIKNRSKLRKLNFPTPIQRNETRWSSTLEMVTRYIKYCTLHV
ncbi:TPA: hypothetical protein N0F65_004778 [Lagenidium giganteum]|uniref:Uncharacterized protein n=1 Tax=Lagenidium giganteum TaxID=4803 RepID=A0AAV2Z450_9STRA|nr:TPA: hypothetical protein N0F65_004778 [Lagenidium giganteum]